MPPSASGDPKPGQMLTSSSGSWTGTTPLAYGYQWLRCDSNGSTCVAIPGATTNAYTVVSADLGSTIRSRVSASNVGGQASAQSVQTALVTNLQTLTFTGTLAKNSTAMSFPVTTGAGQADATLSFAKSATLMLKVVDANGNVFGQASGKASPVKLTVAGLSDGTYRYVVSGTGYKGSVSSTLTVTSPAP
jgi:hypothetical protein